MQPRHVVASIGGLVLLLGTIFLAIHVTPVAFAIFVAGLSVTAGGLAPDAHAWYVHWRETRPPKPPAAPRETWEPVEHVTYEPPRPPEPQVIRQTHVTVDTKGIIKEMRRLRRSRQGNAQGCGCLLVLIGIGMILTLFLAPIGVLFCALGFIIFCLSYLL